MFMHLKKVDDDLQIVYGEVYSPNVPDSQGDFMLPEEVRKMAHTFLAKGSVTAIDLMHDNQETGSIVVESFISESTSETYIPDSWVLGVFVENTDIWEAIKSGKINGFSLEALVKSTETVIEVEVDEVIRGETLPDDTGHSHTYEVRFDEEGNFLGGSTGQTNGHVHPIRKATITEKAEDGHVHRFSIVEELQIVEA